jgi:hypothetical protein
MTINWPGASLSRIDVAPAIEQEIRAELDLLGKRIAELLTINGFAQFASPLFRPWGLVVGVQPDRILVAFLEQSGMPNVLFLNMTTTAQRLSPEAFAAQLRAQLNAPVTATFVLDPPGTSAGARAETRERLASKHVAEVDRTLALGRLGDLTGFGHLEPQLRSFLADHPDPDRNVFIMMRFKDTDQFRDLHRAIADTLSTHGLQGVRADDREYHPDLWSNVETYMLGCKYGVAAFEDFETRDHNPNVALELGFMRARLKRCLILKERTLPAVPTDVVGSLYKLFDKFNVSETVRAQVNRWITVDLGIA